MAEIAASVRSRSREAVRILSRLGRVRAAYIFGSHAQGAPGPWSDLDIAAFMEGVEGWDIQRRARAMVLVQKAVGPDVEAHLFPARVLENPPPGSFAQYVMRHGILVESEDPLSRTG